MPFTGRITSSVPTDSMSGLRSNSGLDQRSVSTSRSYCAAMLHSVSPVWPVSLTGSKRLSLVAVGVSALLAEIVTVGVIADAGRAGVPKGGPDKDVGTGC